MASLVVTGNRLHAQERPGIIVSLALLQMALGLEKRRRWREKDATRHPRRHPECGSGCVALTGDGQARERSVAARVPWRSSKPQGVVMVISSVLRGEPR